MWATPSPKFVFVERRMGAHQIMWEFDRYIPNEAAQIYFRNPRAKTWLQAETRVVVYTIATSANGIAVMPLPNEEKQILEGIRRNVIEMNRRLHDISRLVGATALIGVVACFLLLLILWRYW